MEDFLPHFQRCANAQRRISSVLYLACRNAREDVTFAAGKKAG